MSSQFHGRGYSKAGATGSAAGSTSAPNTNAPNYAPHTSNSSNNRQSINANKYDQAQSQQHQSHTVQAQQLQPHKAKIVSTEYTTVPLGHQSTSHPHVALQNNYRMSHQPNSYVPSSSVSYPSDVQRCPQQPPTALQPAERLPVSQIGQQQTQSQPPQQPSHQDHKMQPQPSQQQASQPQLQTTFIARMPSQNFRNMHPRGGENAAAGVLVHAQHPRSLNHMQSSNVQHPSQQILYAGMPAMGGMQHHRFSHGPVRYANQHYNSGHYLFPIYQSPTAAGSQQSQQRASNIHSMGINTQVSGGANLTMQSASHQPMNTQLLSQGWQVVLPQQQQQRTRTEQRERKSCRIPIIHPETQEEVDVEGGRTQSSNTQSSALKIESPDPPQTPNPTQNPHQAQAPNSRTLSSTTPASIDGNPAIPATNETTNTNSKYSTKSSNQNEQSSCDQSYSNAPHQSWRKPDENSGDASTADEPPHTPVVSAIADGPSVDITPKQSKNNKRTNKSPEWPAPSDKPHMDATGENLAKSVAPATSIAEQATPINQQPSKASSEAEIKDLPQPAPVQQKQQPPPTQQFQQQQNTKLKYRNQQDTQSNKPHNKMETTNSQSNQSLSSNTSSQNAPAVDANKPQKVEHTNISESLNKLNEPVTGASDNVASKVEAATVLQSDKAVEAEHSPASKTDTNNDETDKVFNSLETLSISETSTSKNDKLNTESLEFNNNSHLDKKEQQPQHPQSQQPQQPTPPPPQQQQQQQQQQPQPQPPQQHITSAKTQQLPEQPAKPEAEQEANIIEESKAADKQPTTNASDDASTVEPISATIDTNAGSIDTTKDITNHVPIDSSSAEEINNIKNNNLTNSTTADSNANTTLSEKPITEAAKAQANKLKLNLVYAEGQWSPENTEGKRSYKRDQLIMMRDIAPCPLSSVCLTEDFQLVKRSSNSSAANNNNKNQSMSGDKRPPYGKRSSTQGGSGNQQMQQGSKKGSRSGLIQINLSLGEDVKLNESANAWKPNIHVSNGSNQNEDLSNIDVLVKKVRGILNKLTPEKFEPLLDQIQALNLETDERLSSVISLVFEKAIDESHFAAAYAQLCQKLSRPIEEKEEAERKTGQQSAEKKDTKLPGFKKELLNKCQKEFDHHVANEDSICSKLLPLQTELNETASQNRKMELTMQIEEEERKLRRRSVGTVRFIGELYRQNMLSTKIMDWCVAALLKTSSEDKLECLCKLLTTVGEKMETDVPDRRTFASHFTAMQNIINSKGDSKISSRVRFMLMDVIELRKSNWVSRRTDTNPKKMGQIVKEAEQEQYNKYIQAKLHGSNNNMRKDHDRNDRGMRSDSRGGSMSGSGYNNNSNKLNRGGYQDNEGWIQTSSNKNRSGNNNTSFDPTKLQQMGKLEGLTQSSLGNSKQFQWKPHKQQSTTTANPYSALEHDSFKSDQNRSKEPYHSKGSLERDREGPGSRSGSQHGSRDSSAARNSYSSRSLQMRPQTQSSYNSTLPMNSTPAASLSQRAIRSDIKQSNHQSLSSSTTSLSTSNLPVSSSSTLTPSSSDPKITDETKISTIIRNMVKKLQTEQLNLDEGARKIEDVHESHRQMAIRELHNMAADMTGPTEAKLCYIGQICHFWLKQKFIVKQDYVQGVSEYLNTLADIEIDVPKIFEWTAQMISLPIYSDMLSISDLKNVDDESRGKLLGKLLPYLGYDGGPQFLRDLWKRSKCTWEDFVVDGDVKRFIESNKLSWVENTNETLPAPAKPVSNDRLRQRVRQFIRREVQLKNEVDEYIRIHVPNISNKQSIRLITKVLIDAAVDKIKGEYILKQAYLRRSIDILKGYIGHEDAEDLQLESTFAIQLLSNELEHPSDFLPTIFSKLYDDEIVSVRTFREWRNSPEEQVGKGVAVKKLVTFFKFLDDEDCEAEDTEESTRCL